MEYGLLFAISAGNLSAVDGLIFDNRQSRLSCQLLNAFATMGLTGLL